MTKKAKLVVAPCDCKSAMQDMQFGKGKRAHRVCHDENTGQLLGVKCCVCGSKKSVEMPKEDK